MKTLITTALIIATFSSCVSWRETVRKKCADQPDPMACEQREEMAYYARLNHANNVRKAMQKHFD